MPDFLYNWSIWWINLLHMHPALWWSIIAFSVAIQLPRFKRG